MNNGNQTFFVFSLSSHLPEPNCSKRKVQWCPVNAGICQPSLGSYFLFFPFGRFLPYALNKIWPTHHSLMMVLSVPLRRAFARWICREFHKPKASSDGINPNWRTREIALCRISVCSQPIERAPCFTRALFPSLSFSLHFFFFLFFGRLRLNKFDLKKIIRPSAAPSGWRWVGFSLTRGTVLHF